MVQAFAVICPFMRQLAMAGSPVGTWLAKYGALTSLESIRRTAGAEAIFSNHMGQRREPRKQIRVPVRIFGTNAQGRTFSENVFTVDVSRQGARLTGVTAEIRVGELIGLTYAQNRSRFSVKWTGSPGTPRQGEIGLQNSSPEKSLWDFSLPEAVIDQHGGKARASERRRFPRIHSTNSAELHVEGQTAPIWGKATDLSAGGCFVEMPIPLKQGTLLKVGLWIQKDKLWLNGKVASSRPGFGIGIEFIKLSAQDSDTVLQFLRSISRTPF
jgi:PilZ domain